MTIVNLETLEIDLELIPNVEGVKCIFSLITK